MKGKRRGLLPDVFVLDLADEQGSFCSKLLADLGAAVVKVEQPQGNPARRSGPFRRSKSDSNGTGFSFFFHNTNKLGIVLDLKSSKGKESLRRLIERADVVVETLSKHSLEALDLSEGRLRSINPRIIHISITGFGRSGPKKSYCCSDSVASAYGGQMYLSGATNGPPVKLSGIQSSYTASLYAANAALLLLRKRRATGKGSYLDLSVQESVASTLDHVMIDFFQNGEIAGRKHEDNSSESFVTFPCKDGYIQIPVYRNWETVLQLMNSEGNANGLAKKKWLREAYRKTHRTQIREAVGGWTANHKKWELFNLGQAMRFPWAPVCTVREVLASPQLKARRFFIPAQWTGSAFVTSIPGLPYKFSRFSPPAPRPAPSLGEHTQEVLDLLRSGNRNGAAVLRRQKRPGHSLKSGDILGGVRVVDFTRMLSGPYATRILADFGAEVIKVQSQSTAQGAERNDTPYFASWSRNKRSVCVNLNHSDASGLILELVARSDVVVENFSPRVMANWGLSYKRLRQVKPDLIMASISAMGQTGPWKNYIGFAPTFHALSGLMSPSVQSPENPIGIRHSYGDVITGLYAAIAILASLEHRSETGKGQYIDLSAYEAMCTLLGPSLMEAHSALKLKASGMPVENYGEDLLCGCYPCAGDDRWCVFNIDSEAQWQALFRISRNRDLKSERFASKAGRKANRAELEKLIAEWTLRHPAETVAQRLQSKGIAAGVVQNAEDLARDSQLAERRFFVSLKHPALGEACSDRSALWPWREKPAEWKAAPRLGEDNRYVFVELLGHSDTDFRSLVKRGVIQQTRGHFGSITR